ncbi:alginate lyase family protein [Litchfieldella rifensis]|uniref:Alginate lyase family protein n=1 Tax=Litchfieldella rifensis TaxID=762643 RepID=A0ABV7LLF8_9GAMM
MFLLRSVELSVLSRLSLVAGLVMLLAASSSASAMTQKELAEKEMSLEEREALDLSEYTVTAPDASYFDIEARRALLQGTDNSLLLTRIDQLRLGPSCQQLLAIPPITSRLRVPSYYPNPDQWKLASEPLFRFEDSVSELAGAYLVSNDPYYAECLVRFLDHWASNDALMNFYYDSKDPQAWFSTESMIFAAAMAYSTVRPDLTGMHEERERIEDWLSRLAHRHVAIPGAQENSCCNNHFYRRALYASMVGVLTEDNELFRFGVSAIYAALHEMTEEGAFPREVTRGRRATHYQNYALLYLITNMEVIARQGYDIFDLSIEGRTIHDAVDFAMDLFEDPTVLGEVAPREQYLGFLKDDQYFSWMEIYQSRFHDPRVANFLKTMRPIYNRSAGGYMTLYFMDPKAQQNIVLDEEQREAAAFEGLSSQ